MLRARVVRAARRAGLEPQLRRVQELVASPRRRRDLRDNRQIERLLAATLPPDGNYVDAGACEGELLRHAVRFAPAGRHIAFEPLPELAQALRESFPGVEVHESALYAEAGRRTFHRVRDGHWYSSLSALGRPASELDSFEVAVERLDDALGTGYVPHVIKIDVEGAEAGVLAGACDTLRRHRPIVIFEHGAHAAHFPDADVLAPLVAAGLRVFDIDGGGPYDRETFTARVRRGDMWTFVARP